jgi:Ca2+-dependent lipid-binding protein
MTLHHYIDFNVDLNQSGFCTTHQRHRVLLQYGKNNLKKDPYCILRLGAQVQRTNTKNEAGKKPVWNQSFRFSNPDNDLKVIVMDEDSVTDDLVGEADVDISRFRNSSA